MTLIMCDLFVCIILRTSIIFVGLERELHRCRYRWTERVGFLHVDYKILRVLLYIQSSDGEIRSLGDTWTFKIHQVLNYYCCYQCLRISSVKCLIETSVYLETPIFSTAGLLCTSSLVLSESFIKRATSIDFGIINIIWCRKSLGVLPAYPIHRS